MTMRKILFLILIFTFIVSCDQNRQQTSQLTLKSLPEIVKNKESDLFSIAYDRYKSDTKDLPIGVFDSGIGGLTVLAEILKLDSFNNETHEPGTDGLPDFDNERFIYLGDQANMPYGNYPSENKVDFLKELIIKDAIFLLGERYWLISESTSPRNDKPPVKAIIIACNTATAYGLEDVRSALELWDVPVYVVGVVEAGARGAVEELARKGTQGAVAVMATVGTCKSEGYVRAVEKAAKEAGIKQPEVVQQGSLGLAGAIEGDPSFIGPQGTTPRTDYKGPAAGDQNAPIDTGKIVRYGFDRNGITGNPDDPTTWQLNSIENYVRYDTTMLIDTYSQSGETDPIAAVILGCTHFPYQVKSIAASFERLRNFQSDDGSQPYKNLIAEHISFIDPATLTAEQLYESLAKSALLLSKGESMNIPTDEFFISVPNTSLKGTQLTEHGGFSYDYKYSREPGNFNVEYVKRVPMSRDNLSSTVIESIKETMPVIWERLVLFNNSSTRCGELPESSKLR
ncbi:MAG: aspartate/glutamate racemase family protein [Candidatus Latescibacteria bacterium]|nr:aspartate/glutamate racemase family protein [Candidatus Latescibacterota bacterium]